MIELNKIYNEDCLIGMQNIPDRSIDIICADPPYYKVKGFFDFVYNNYDEYLELVESWAKEFKRVLKPNGSILYFGHAKSIAYSQIILDKYFKLENNLVWRKTDCQTRKGKMRFRVFCPITERCLFYTNEKLHTGLESIMSSSVCFVSIKNYMRNERTKIIEAMEFTTLKQFNDYINEITETKSVVSRHYFADIQYMFPTKEIYLKLQSTGYFSREYEELRLEYEELRLEYEELRLEYEELRRPFNNIYELDDVIDASQEAHISKKYNHPTQKPVGLISKLIQTISYEGAIILDPFMGSGTTAVACINTNRNFIGFETDKGYYDMSLERIESIAPQLFTNAG